MNSRTLPLAEGATEEVGALIETLHKTGRRLEDLTEGEVDAVTNRHGQTVMLRRAQDQLRHREAARQTAILNALPANIALLDAEGVIVSVNEAWRRFAGANALLSAACAIGLNYLEICDRARGDDAAVARQTAAGIRSVLSGGLESFSLEYPCHSPAERRWFRLLVTPLTRDRPGGAVVMHLDITGEKEANERLRVSDLQIRQMTDNIRDVFFLLDADGQRMLYVSPAYEEVWGRSCESLYANPESWTESIHPDDRAVAYENYKQSMSVGSLEFGYRIVRPDGSIRWIETRAFPIRDDTGKIIRITGVAKDVTERTLVTQELRESERRFSDILRNVELVSMTLDRDARITYCNDHLLRLSGWRHEDVIGKNWFEIFMPSEIRTDMKAVFAALLADDPEIRHHENAILTRSGERRLIRWNNSLLRSGAGEVIGTASIGEDITEQKRAEEELRRLVAAMDTTADAIYLVDRASLCFVHVNDAACRMMNQSREALLALKPWEILSISRAELERTYDALIASGVEAEPLELLRPRAGGAQAWVELRRRAHRSGDRWVIVTLVREITERKQAEDRIRRLNRVYAMLSGINTLIVRVRDRDELFREACRIAVEDGQFTMAWIGVVDRDAMTLAPVASAGTTPDAPALIKQRFSLLEDAPHGNILSARAIREKKVFVSNDVQTDSRILFKEDHAKRGSRSLAVLPLLGAEDAIGVLALYAGEPGFFDAEEMKLLTELAGDIAYAIDHIEKQDRLDYVAFYDSLTGLANRSLFLERVAQHMRSAADGGHKLAVFLIDLERFRNINESLGRPAGDVLLKQVADWLTRTTGDASLLARVGVDHFAVVLPLVREDGNVAGFLEKWREAFLKHPFRLNDAVFRLGAKVGVAQFPDDGGDAETLFRNAEAALKKAKTSGHRYLFYTQAMTEAGAGRLTMENQLRQALDREEFVLHYQPKLSLASGKLTGAEALIRWNDPRTGLVPPGRFIPILEDIGLIHEVGRWALRKAIEDYLRWLAAGLPAVRIAVNVSALQLRSPGFIAEIGQAIGADARAAAGLELEVTESVIMEDTVHTMSSLAAIRAMGLTIAIDDFGTGFSSLSYLARLPVDSLKIDRSFINDMTASSEGLALVSTVIGLAHALKLKVVAEGVETEEQSRLLRLLNCDEMQGFLFSKPVPVEMFEATFLAAAPST